MPLDCEVIDYVATQVADYIKRSNYKTVVLVHDAENWGNNVKLRCRSACQKKGTTFKHLSIGAQSTKEFLTSLETILKSNLSE
jgi:ABC-type branched-subunit amino acid transport system substrate-binding protein